MTDQYQPVPEFDLVGMQEAASINCLWAEQDAERDRQYREAMESPEYQEQLRAEREYNRPPQNSFCDEF
jgi:hypothetical protein